MGPSARQKTHGHLLQFRQIGEPGETATRFECRPVRRNLHRVNHFAERRGPGIEVVNSAIKQSFQVKEPCIVYISTIVFADRVPVANVRPWPACRSSR